MASMRTYGCTAIFLLLIVLQAYPVAALEPPAVERLVLANGMTFLLLPRESTSISFEVRVKTGSVDEPRGKTGLTHMLEHMMFKGTRSIGTRDYGREKPLLDRMDQVALKLQSSRGAEQEALKDELASLSRQASLYQVPGEFDRIYARAGGVGLNASTSPDLTSYHVTLPRDRLEFWAIMESQRMRYPVFREFYTEREVVLRERAQRVDSNDKGTLYEKFMLHAFPHSPYHTPVIGFREDVERLTSADLKDYYQTFYQPQNTVVAIVGGFDTLKAVSILTHYFGTLKRGPATPRQPAGEALPRIQVRLRMSSKEEPFMLMGFHKLKGPIDVNACFDVIEEILGGAHDSRLEKSLVNRGLASGVDAYNGYPGSRYDNLFLISASPVKGRTNAELEQVLWKEMEKLGRDGISTDELAKAVRTVKKSVLLNLETDAGAANILSLYESLAGDYGYIYKIIDVMEKLTPEQVRECARTYLTPENAIIAALEE